jgi:hypothetical protein
MTDVNLFETMKRHVCACALDLKLSSDIEALLKMPMQELHVSIPVRMDDGTLRVFPGYRIHYNDARGPQKEIFVINRELDEVWGYMCDFFKLYSVDCMFFMLS